MKIFGKGVRVRHLVVATAAGVGQHAKQLVVGAFAETHRGHRDVLRDHRLDEILQTLGGRAPSVRRMTCFFRACWTEMSW